jgi:hypothetical protein
MEHISEAFHKVFDHLDEVVEFSRKIEFPMMPKEHRTI